MDERDGPGRRNRIAVALLVASIAAILGLNLVALKVAIRGSDPVTVQAFAAVAGAVSMFVVTAGLGSPLRLERHHLKGAAVAASLLTVGSSLGIAFGVQRVDASVAALLVSTTPIATFVFEGLIMSHRHSWHGFIGLLGGFGGVAVVAFGAGRSGGANELLGVVFMVAGALGWSLGLIAMRQLAGDAPRSTFIAWQMVLGIPVLLAVGYLTTGLGADWTALFIAAVLYAGAFGKGLSFVLQLTTVRLGTSVDASLTAFLMPVSGTIAGVLLLDETIGLEQVAGAVLILFGVGLVLRSKVSVTEADESLMPGA